MSQQINLLNPALLKKKDLLNPVNIVAIIGFLLVGVITFGVYEQLALDKAKIAQQASAKALAETQTLLTQMRAQNANNDVKQKRLSQIQQLENKKSMQKAMLEAAQHDQSHQGESYAALLKAFAKQSMDGLWITALTIDQDAQHLSISGRTMNPDLVPNYIDRLRKEPALHGKKFTNLSMQYKEAKQTPSDSESQNNALAVKTVSATTRVTQEATKDAVVLKIPYIEFTLHSEPDSEKATNDAQQPKVAGVH